MTILSTEKVLQQPRALLWRMASQFERAPQWFDGVKKAERVSGQVANLGGVWRANLDWGGLHRIIYFEITEWLEGERFGLRPLNMSIVEGDTELYQIVFNFKELAEDQTQVTVQCDYEPRQWLAKIKNLLFLRRRYLQRLEASLAVLERVAGEQAASSWSNKHNLT